MNDAKHWSSGYTGAPSACEIDVRPDKRRFTTADTTQYDSAVTCKVCKEELRKYRIDFPQAHPEKMLGGRR